MSNVVIAKLNVSCCLFLEGLSKLNSIVHVFSKRAERRLGFEATPFFFLDGPPKHKDLQGI